MAVKKDKTQIPETKKRMNNMRDKKSIIGSIFTISILAVLMLTSTHSYFSDTETSTGNTFTAGTIDLSVNEGNPLQITISDIKPGEYYETGAIEVENIGTNPGILGIQVKNVVDDGNGYNEPEHEADPTDKINDISNWTWIEAWIDWSGNGEMEGDEIVLLDKLFSIRDIEDLEIKIGKIDPTISYNMYFKFHLSPDTGNEYQSDKTTFDLEFSFVQEAGKELSNIFENPTFDYQQTYTNTASYDPLEKLFIKYGIPEGSSLYAHYYGTTRWRYVKFGNTIWENLWQIGDVNIYRDAGETDLAGTHYFHAQETFYIEDGDACTSINTGFGTWYEPDSDSVVMERYQYALTIYDNPTYKEWYRYEESNIGGEWTWEIDNEPFNEQSQLVPPANLRISTASPDILLEWDASPCASKYNIYRCSPHINATKTTNTWDFDFSNPIGTTTGTYWQDVNACDINDPNFAWKYYYIVRAEDSDGNEEGNFNIVGKESINLSEGRNWIHWIGETTSITNALSNIISKVSTVQRWDHATDKYESFNPNLPPPLQFLNDFYEFEKDKGYMINIKSGYDGTIWTHFNIWTNSILNGKISESLLSPSKINLTVEEENIKLNWSDVSGVSYYNIYRTTFENGFDFSNPVANTINTEWIDFDANNPTHDNFYQTYYYIVRAVDSNGNEENNFNVVCKISYVLNEGRNWIRWNGENVNINNALSNLISKVSTVQRWNHLTDRYESYNPNLPPPLQFLNDFYEFENDKGYMINIKSGYSGTVWTYVEG